MLGEVEKQQKLQSSRVQVREKGAENERSSFFAVRRSICCGEKLRIRQNDVVLLRPYFYQTRVCNNGFHLDCVHKRLP